jgi:hypothetical protein
VPEREGTPAVTGERFVIRETQWVGGFGRNEQLDVYVYDTAYCYEIAWFGTTHGMSLSDRRELGFAAIAEGLRNRATGIVALLNDEVNT